MHHIRLFLFLIPAVLGFAIGLVFWSIALGFQAANEVVEDFAVAARARLHKKGVTK